MISRLPQGLNIMGTSRSPDSWSQDLKARVKGLKFSGDITEEIKAALAQAEVLIISLPPSAMGDPFLSALNTDIKALAPHVKWAGYLSATSVYGNRNGQWAYEDELLKPSTDRGRNRAEAELAWLETGLPVHVFRLAGIYGGTYFGQSRNPFARIDAGKARAVIKDDHVVNRIHAEDIAAALLASTTSPNPLRVYNIADGSPAPPQDVLDYAAGLCGAKQPERVTVDSPHVSAMARSFYTETKRIAIARAQGELGWTPHYKDYKTGLASIYDTL